MDPNRSARPAARGDWSAVDPFTSHSFLPAWSFTVRGAALGESRVVLAVSVDGKQVDLFEATIVVVENADAFGEE